MNSDLRKTIQIFLTNYDKKIDDMKIFGERDDDLKYCNLFLETSVNLLRRCMTENKQC